MAKFKNVPDILVLLVIVLVGYVYTSGVRGYVDIGLYDESNYLNWGVSLPCGLLTAENGPLYALWYYVLSFIKRDNVALYFLNYRLMTILPAVMFFAALRARAVSRMLAFALSMALLFNPLTLLVWPKVCNFAVGVLLAGLFFAAFSKNRLVQTSVLLLFTLAASYSRPEYFVSFVLLALILVFLGFHSCRVSRSPRPAIHLAAIALASAVILFRLGLPTAGQRSMMAFGQHYALNWVGWHQDQRNPWTNWETVVQADFGDAHSPSEALFRNPAAVGRHLATNLLSIPRVCVSLLTGAVWLNRFERMAFTLGSLTIFAVGIITARRQRSGASNETTAENVRPDRLSVLLLLVLLVPGAISITMIFPREHYLFAMGILAAFGCCAWLFRNTDRYVESPGIALALLCGLSLMIGRPWNGFHGVWPQENLKTIEFLRSLEIDRPVNLLEAEGGFGIYLGRNFDRVIEYEKDRPFDEFLAAKSINMIVISDNLLTDTRFCDDPQWRAFLAESSKSGFVKLDIPNVPGRYVLCKKELVPRKA